VALDGVHRALAGEMRDQEGGERAAAISSASRVRQHWAVDADRGRLTAAQRGAAIFVICLATAAGLSAPSSPLSWPYVLIDRPEASAYGWSVLTQRVEVELTRAVIPYAPSMGTSIRAWRRPKARSAAARRPF
jgi:hypothetical protein